MLAPQEKIAPVEQQICDFLYRVLNVDGAIFTDESVLFDFCPTKRNYRSWVKQVRQRTLEIYGTTFEEKDPYLWQIGHLLR